MGLALMLAPKAANGATSLAELLQKLKSKGAYYVGARYTMIQYLEVEWLRSCRKSLANALAFDVATHAPILLQDPLLLWCQRRLRVHFLQINKFISNNF